MASSRITAALFLLPLILLARWSAAAGAVGGACCYTSIVSFGDSLADTGNRMVILKDDRISRPPYGETFFHQPTGRFCDGRLMIDFIAEAIGLPFVRPYLGGEGEGREYFKTGVNFAVGGATALDGDYFRARGIEVMWSAYSLSTQLRWFKQLLPSLCSTPSECSDLMGNSLFLVGEIGGNDYNNPIFTGGKDAFEVVKSFVPDVVGAISSAIQELIEMGARTLVVPGNLPVGCSAIYLHIFQSEREEDYDPKTGCINWLNDFAVYHNDLLLQELERLRKQYPEVTIIFADYFEAAMSIYRSPEEYGFGGLPLSACCGYGGAYNVNGTASCGAKGSTVCDDPSSQISWDGIHLTEAAYRVMTLGLLSSYTQPTVQSSCSQINWNVLVSDDESLPYSSAI